jgi:hypothetical protein
MIVFIGDSYIKPQWYAIQEKQNSFNFSNKFHRKRFSKNFWSLSLTHKLPINHLCDSYKSNNASFYDKFLSPEDCSVCEKGKLSIQDGKLAMQYHGLYLWNLNPIVIMKDRPKCSDTKMLDQIPSEIFGLVEAKYLAKCWPAQRFGCCMVTFMEKTCKESSEKSLVTGNYSTEVSGHIFFTVCFSIQIVTTEIRSISHHSHGTCRSDMEKYLAVQYFSLGSINC